MFEQAHVFETSAVAVVAGWPGKELVAAAGGAEVILQWDLVYVPVIALSDPLADTADSRPEVAWVEVLEQLAVDRSAFSEAAQQAHCSEDLGYSTSLVDPGEAVFELTHSQVQN